MDFEHLQVSVDGPTARIELARPTKLNPLSVRTLDELVGAAQWMNEQPGLKVVVVAGQGRAFCAGSDLASVGGAEAGDDPRHAADAGRRMSAAVASMTPVTVARLQGHCIGGGVVLAASCDLRVAAADTNFCIPEIDLGIPLSWAGIPRLMSELGPAMTRELVMTGRTFTAAEALDMRLLNRVVGPAELDAEVDELVQVLAAKPRLPLVMTKRHVGVLADQMSGVSASWNDVDSLITAQRDPESRAWAAGYLDRLASRRRPEPDGDA
jgi:enoyl-CoA hydratase/carnithine racemase